MFNCGGRLHFINLICWGLSPYRCVTWRSNSVESWSLEFWDVRSGWGLWTSDICSSSPNFPTSFKYSRQTSPQKNMQILKIMNIGNIGMENVSSTIDITWPQVQLYQPLHPCLWDQSWRHCGGEGLATEMGDPWDSLAAKYNLLVQRCLERTTKLKYNWNLVPGFQLKFI